MASPNPYFENDRKTTQNAVHHALKMGYRHFDTAHIYGSEPALGNALNDAVSNGVVSREELFVTSKLWGSHHHDPISALQKTLKNMGLEYIDMYLVHWPVRVKPWVNDPTPKEDEFEPLCMELTWTGMEKCLEMGLCRGIGVSNFSCASRFVGFCNCSSCRQSGGNAPYVETKEAKRFLQRSQYPPQRLLPYWGPGNFWGSTAVIENPVVQSLALKRGATPPQIALSWSLSKGASMIVKSFNQERLKENREALDIKLRGEVYVNLETSPYKTIQELWMMRFDFVCVLSNL